MVRLPPIKAIACFEAVARHLSFLRAADELLVTPPAISQQVKLLEEFLGTRLFHRLNRRIALTDDGERYRKSLTSAFVAIGEATLEVSKRRGHEKLLIRSTPSFATQWLMPRLPDFVARNPDLNIEIDSSTETTDFRCDQVDLEIRGGDGSWPELSVEPLTCDRVIPMCSPTLLSSVRNLSEPEDLVVKNLIHSLKMPIKWNQWLELNKIGGVDLSRGLRFTRSHMAIQAAVNGLGIVLELDGLAQSELASGDLVEPFPHLSSIELRYHWLVCPPRTARTAKIAKFRNWIHGQFQLCQKPPRIKWDLVVRPPIGEARLNFVQNGPRRTPV